MRLEDEPPAPYVFAGAEAEKRAAALTAGDGPILAIAPGAEWLGKAWPGERFAEVARRLLSPGGPMAGGRLMLLGGKADDVQADQCGAGRRLARADHRPRGPAPTWSPASRR